MGKPKMLLPFGSATVIENVLIQTALSDIDKTIVVLGANAQKIGDQIAAFNVEEVENTSYEKGMLTSVQSGIKALPPEATAATP